MITVTLKTSFAPLKKKRGETIQVNPIGERDVQGCVYYRQRIYRPIGSNHWIPEEDLILKESDETKN